MAMDPWEISTLTILSVMVFVGILAGGVMFRDKIPGGMIEIPLSLATFLSNVFPFALLVYGFAGDLINQSFRLSIPSFSALISILIIGIGTRVYAVSKGNNLTAQDTSGRLWCSLPGLEQVESPYLPTAFISTTLIAAYYMGWSMKEKTPMLYTGLSFMIVWVIQFLTFIAGDCSPSFLPLIGSSKLPNILIASILGAALGFGTFSIFMSDGSYNPLHATGTTATVTGGTSTNCNTGRCKPEQPGDENTFVAELYKDGQLVTGDI